MKSSRLSARVLGGVLTASPDRRAIYSTFSRQQADLWMVDTKAR